MRNSFHFGSFLLALLLSLGGCTIPPKKSKTAAQLLGNPAYKAIAYGGYRQTTREQQPSVTEIKEDLRLLHAMGIRILRTYNLQFDFAPNVVQAIDDLRTEDEAFEMYVMLGAWINCENAWTATPNHAEEDAVNNAIEIQKAITLANSYPHIVKIIAVGNEAMVHWASSYYVHPRVILKWVNHLQQLKIDGKLPPDLWITSSDDFASWGGGDQSYHIPALDALLRSVDYVSMHTYPFHNTHYNPDFWTQTQATLQGITKEEQIEAAMDRALTFAITQYNNVKQYMTDRGIDKPLHIGETGWASNDNGLYGEEGSQAADEYKQSLYYQRINQWAETNGVSCFYFEAFDEIWKDSANPKGSENHFGLFTVDGKAKYSLWEQTDQKRFNRQGRNQQPVTKTYQGELNTLMQSVSPPKTTSQ